MNAPLHASRIDLSEATRRQMVELLNARLADAVNLSTQMKQAHWNVKGPSFIALHELFDTLHADTLVQVDDLAERITTLGGTALGTAAVAASTSALPEYPRWISSLEAAMWKPSAWPWPPLAKACDQPLPQRERRATPIPKTCAWRFPVSWTRICGWSRRTHRHEQAARLMWQPD